MLLLTLAPARAADEAPAARAALDGITAALADRAADPQPLTLSAEAAAALVLAGQAVSVHDAALGLELAQRPGSLQLLTAGQDGRGGVALVPFDHQPAAAATLAHRLRRQGKLVIGIGAAATLPHAAPSDFAIRTHPRHPGDAPALAAAAAWAWQCELFTACTRAAHGRPPVVRLSTQLDTRHRRFLRYGDQPFHDDLLIAPPPPGDLARAYLGQLQHVLRDLGTTSWPALARAGRTLAAAPAACDAQSTLVAHTALRGDWRPFTAATTGGVLLVLGDTPWPPDLPLDRPRFDRIVWVLPALGRPQYRLPRGSIVIDTQTPLEDALVKIPGYDARVGGSQGVVSLIVLRLLEAQRDDTPPHLAGGR